MVFDIAKITVKNVYSLSPDNISCSIDELLLIESNIMAP